MGIGEHMSACVCLGGRYAPLLRLREIHGLGMLSISGSLLIEGGKSRCKNVQNRCKNVQKGAIMAKTVDDAVKLLMKIQDDRKHLRDLQDYLTKMDAHAEYQSPCIDGGGGGHAAGKQDPRGMLLMLLADARMEKERLEQEVMQQENTLRSVLLRLPDWHKRELLIMRYLRLYKWQDIADNLGYDLRYVYKLHLRALEDLQGVLTDMGLA